MTYRVGHSATGKIVRRVCRAIWETLKEESFPGLTEERWKEIAERFQMSSQFPSCLGATYGKHVRIRKPRMSGSLFYNYKNYFSVVLLAIVDTNYKFIYIDAGAFGKDSDRSIFERTDFCKKLENNELNIPKGQPLLGTVGPNTPYTFIGNEAFSLSQNVMRPYSGKVLSQKKNDFQLQIVSGPQECREYIWHTLK